MDHDEQSATIGIPIIVLAAEQERGNQEDEACSFGGSTQEDMLLLVAMGHALRGSQSPLALLSKDLLEHFLAPIISQAFWQSRCAAGLVTPPSIRARPHGQRAKLSSLLSASPVQVSTRLFFLPPAAPLLVSLSAPNEPRKPEDRERSCAPATARSRFRALGGALSERFARLDESALPDLPKKSKEVELFRRRRIPS